MLQHFIETKRSDSSPPQLATKDEIMVDSTIILGAGADTTSIVVQPILGDLAMHPRADSKLQFKIDQAYQGLSLTDRAAEISYNDAAKLPYLAPSSSKRTPQPVLHVLDAPLYAQKGTTNSTAESTGRTVCRHQSKGHESLQRIFGEDADDFVYER